MVLFLIVVCFSHPSRITQSWHYLYIVSCIRSIIFILYLALDLLYLYCILHTFFWSFSSPLNAFLQNSPPHQNVSALSITGNNHIGRHNGAVSFDTWSRYLVSFHIFVCHVFIIFFHFLSALFQCTLAHLYTFVFFF